jgi:hypothetical protein
VVGWGQGFRKNCNEGPPISGLIAFLFKSVLKFVWGDGPILALAPLPLPVCFYVTELNWLVNFIIK